jgi:peptide/nickel transport system substrate-binding protein
VKAGKSSKEAIVTFAKPFPDYKSLWGSMLPAHIFASGGPKAFNTLLEGKPPTWTGGPYKITAFNKNNSITLTRWDGYYGKAPNLDTVTYRWLGDESTEPAALSNGEVDLIYPQPQTDLVKSVAAIPNVKSSTILGAQFEHLDFNEGNAFLADQKVRLAIAQAIDRNQMVNATVKQFTSSATPLNNRIYLPGQQGFQDNSGGLGTGDTAAAEKTLTDDGFTKSGQWMTKGGKQLSLGLSTTSGNPLRQNEENIIKAQLAKVGIKVNIINYTADKFFGDITVNQKYDMCIFAWVGTPFPISGNVPIYRTKGGDNWTGYSNKQVDQWLDQASQETDPTKAAVLMNQADKQLWADVDTLPLYQKPSYLAYRTKFVNIQDNPTSEGPPWNIWSWGQKTS